MANSISNIVQEALAGLKLIKQEISTLNDEFAKASKNASQVFKGGGNIAEYEKRISSLEKALAKMYDTSAKGAKKEQQEKKKQLEQIEKEQELRNRLSKQRESEEKKRFQELRRLSRARKKEEAELKRTEGLYNRVQRGINSVKQRYRELAVRKELNGKLSQKEIIELGKLEAKLNKYQTALKKVDAGMGVYTRSVGSYGKAFDSLGFSVAQITRESPAFLNSLNTGFMAISNNLPILVDEINKLRVANIQLDKDGKPTVNILKRLGAAIFSWQSLISAAIVALTVLGPKIGEFFQDLSKGNNVLRDSKDILEELDESTKEKIGRLQVLVAIAKDVNRSDIERKKAMEAINDEYDELLGNLEDEENAYTKLNNTVQDYINLLVKEAQIKSLQEKIGEKTLKIIESQELQKSLEKKLIKEGIELNENQVKSILELDKATRDSNLTAVQREMALNQLKNELSELDNRTSVYVGSLIAEQKATDDLTSLLDALLDLNIDISKEREEGNSKKRKNIKLLGAESEAVNSFRKELEEKIKLLEKLVVLYADNDEAVAKYREEIDLLKKAIKGLVDINVDDALEDSLKATRGVIRNATKPDNDLGSEWRDYFLSLVPIAQNAFKLIANAQKAATQQLLADLEKQKDIAIQFAGESAEARAAVEEEFNRKKRAIQKKQAESEKKQAIFEITLNTAAAVVSALKKGPVFAAIVGALGAAQLAVAASTPIPEFFRGTMNAPEGLALVDEKRPEVHTDRHGNIKSFGEGKANYRYLERGDKIYKSREEYFSKEIEANIPFNSAMMAYQMAIHNNNQDTLSKADFNRGIDKLMSKETSVVNINKAGFTASVISGNAKKNKMNNILRLKKGIV